MQKYKVCVYAISKNESQFVERWVSSMAEADEIYVLDTGSTDDTVSKFKEMGVNVRQEVITPWRFDTARNRSLEFVPEDADICVCVDIDEYFHPGWREKMERAWAQGARRLSYRYTWNFLPNGSEGCVFWTDKAHSRKGFKWVNPVHEVLEFTEEGTYVIREAEGVQLDHRADPTKSRGQYLPLLELAVEENPMNDRNTHYLGREYMFHGMWPECEKTLLKHLSLPTATWPDERCASMRFLARAVKNQGREEEAMRWLYRAIAEAPYLREPWIETAEFLFRKKDWAGSLYFSQKALEIKDRGHTYINEAESWGSKPYDIAAVSAYYLGLYDLALVYGEKAFELERENERLAENLLFYRSAVGK